MSPDDLAEQITRDSHSNLALAFVCLPKRKKTDITLFYAFCRIVDDIADSAELEPDEKQGELDLWKRSLQGPAVGEHALAASIRNLILDHSLEVELFREIISGVEMDVLGANFATFNELKLYCYRVASAVGLVSIELFGCKDPRCKAYAEALGMALQLTNILRDIHQDFQNGGRVYLPEEDLQRFGLSKTDFAKAPQDERFLALMHFEAARAFDFFQKAESLLPRQERHNTVPAEIMRRVYKRLLTSMQKDGFRVFTKRYRVSKPEKLFIIFGALLDSFFHGLRGFRRSK